jgi:small subunit ribosomal protein S2
MLTNWSTMYLRISELDRLSKMRDSGDYGGLTKKEILLINREITRLETHLSGVRNMKRVPELLFVVDVSREDTAIHEANLVGIPVIAMVDTNCDPRGVDYVIPSNDDAIRAIKLMVSKIADAAIEGKAARKDEEMGEFAPATPAVLEPHRPAMENEVELEDKDLLGAATLAKLGPVAEEVADTEEVSE